MYGPVEMDFARMADDTGFSFFQRIFLLLSTFSVCKENGWGIRCEVSFEFKFFAINNATRSPLCTELVLFYLPILMGAAEACRFLIQ